MKPRLFVRISEQSGLPYARVPERAVWDLVEYLSYQRVRVSYSYDRHSFTVSFLQCDREMAQQLLEEWAMSEHLEPAFGGEA